MSKRVRVKPSKGQSMVGFFAGIVFCVIGFFVIIPGAGAFGYLWTLFAIIITISNGVNAFTDKGIASHEITIDDDSYHETIKDGKSVEERLRELHNLYEKGMINEVEYQKKREEILKDI